MYGSRLLVRLLISEVCILDICEHLERVHCLLDQEVIDKIRELETTYQGRATKTILLMP
jgi:hypothetical protein